MRIIAGGKQLATMSGSVLTLGAAVNDELTIGEATAMAVDGDLVDDSGLDGETVLVRVEYDDPASDGTDFEVGEWTYSSTAGTLTRVATEFSSSGTSAVTFTSTVVVYGVLVSSQVHNNDVRILQRGHETSFGTYTTAHATTSYVAGHTTALTVTPTVTGSNLRYWLSADVRGRQTASGVSNRAATKLHYENSSSVYTEVHRNGFSGQTSFPSDPDQGWADMIILLGDLTSTHHNASGDWELKAYIKIVDANTEVDLVDLDIVWEEWV